MPGSRSLLGADTMQTATAQLEGTTGGSTASTTTLQISKDGSVDVKGTASALAGESAPQSSHRHPLPAAALFTLNFLSYPLLSQLDLESLNLLSKPTVTCARKTA